MMDEVIISDHGGGNSRRVPIVAASASWEISGIGKFSAFATMDDLRAAGAGGELTDAWLEWVHPVAGRWGGTITGRPISDGLPEITAESWASLLRGFVIEHWLRPVAGQPGGLMRRALIDAGANGDSFITLGTIDEGGIPIEARFGAEDVLEDTLATLGDEGDMEWLVDEDRTFHARRRFGVDRSASVRLVEGRHIVTYRIADDSYAAPAAETLSLRTDEETIRARLDTTTTTVAATDPQIVWVTGRQVTYQPGRKKGRRRRVRTWRFARLVGAPHAPAFPDDEPVPPGPGVAVDYPLPPATIPMEMVIRNTDDAWRVTQLGDSVRVDIGSAGFSGIFRVMGRGIDVASDTMTLAGEAMEVES